MNRIRHTIARAPRMVVRVAVALCACAGAPVQASSPVEEAQAWPEVETVRTLLRADAAAALADCNVPGICRPGTERADPGEHVSAQQDDIRVAAIFGSTRRLTIDVLGTGFIAEIMPQAFIAQWLGPDSGLAGTAIATLRHAPSPQAMPSAAVTHTVAAVVKPSTMRALASRRITPAPTKLMPVITPWMMP